MHGVGFERLLKRMAQQLLCGEIDHTTEHQQQGAQQSHREARKLPANATDERGARIWGDSRVSALLGVHSLPTHYPTRIL